MFLDLSTLFAFRPLELESEVLLGQLLFTLGVLVTLILIRMFLFRALNRSKTLIRENKRRIMVNTNSLLSFVFFVSLVLIWSQELSALALSFVAIAAAMVIATKEIIMCITGGIFKATTNLCSIGDRIHVGEIRGDVIDRTVLATKVMEVGPGLSTNHYTGRVVTIPNSIFVTQPSINESVLRQFVLHTIIVPMSYKANWKRAEEVLLGVSQQVCGPHLEQARRYVDRLQSRANLETPKVEPRVRLHFVDKDELQLILRVTLPSKDLVPMEQEIKRQFLLQFNEWE